MKKNVLITGASSGIGFETALLFAHKGYTVTAISDRNKDGLDSLADTINDNNGKVFTFLKDVSRYDLIKELFEELSENNLLPDILINNAGISHIGLIQDMDISQWNSVLNTNLTSVFNLSNAAIPHMVARKSGTIINISSMWGNTGASCETAYSASKGGVNSFTRALAKELAPCNIAVNAVAFGMVDTRMNAFLDIEERARLIDEIPAGRILSPAEAADIIYSVANMNHYVTGQIITADGGMT